MARRYERKSLKAGFVTATRYSPRMVMGLLDACEKAGWHHPPGSSLSAALAQGIRILVNTAIDSKLIPDREGFEYLEMIEPFQIGTQAAKLSSSMRQESLQAHARSAGMPEAPHISPRFDVQVRSLGRYQVRYDELFFKMDKDADNMLPHERQQFEDLQLVLVGDTQLSDLTFTPSGEPKAPSEGG